VVPVPVLPVLLLAAAATGVLVLAAVPAVLSARSRPGHLLRAE
jgi:hypothetical protein